jgi:hypothetical protein
LTHEHLCNGPSRRNASDVVWALGIGVASCALLVVVNLPFLSSFAISGDDYALVHHSARFFSPSLVDWIGSGYRGYNIDFPELGGAATNFIRPTVNATVYIDSWLSSSPRSVTLLFSNYVGHSACVALVFLVGRSIFGLSRRASVLASSLLLGSVAVGLIPQSVAYRGDMIAALFALVSLLALHSHLYVRPAVWKIMLVGGSLLLALFAKESALAAPLILAIDALWIRPPSFDREASAHEATSAPATTAPLGPVVLAIALPSALFAIARLAAGLNGMYVTEALPTTVLGVPRVLLEPVRFALTTFFPVETDTIKGLVTGATTGFVPVLGLVRGALAVGLNIVGWLAIARLLFEPTERPRLWPLLGMGILASAVPILKAEPRIMYFSQTLLLPLFVYAITHWWALQKRTHRRLPRWVVPIGVSLLLAIGPSYYIARQINGQPGLVAYGQATRQLQDAVLGAIADPSIHRLYLMNATSSMSPGLSLLRFLADAGGRPDLRLRVINTFGGDIPADDGRGAVKLIRRGDYLEGFITAGSSQTLFRDLSYDEAQRLGESGLIEYGPLTQFDVDRLGHSNFAGSRLSFRIPNASREDFAIVGLDPGREGVFALVSPDTRWTRVS